MTEAIDQLRTELRAELRNIWSDVRLQLGAIVDGARADRTIAADRHEAVMQRIDAIAAQLGMNGTGGREHG